MPTANSIPAFIAPIHLEYFSGWVALGLFALLGSYIVLLGQRSLAGQGTARKWVAISLRLLVILLIILILGGAQVQRESKIVEAIVLRDISQSTSSVEKYPGKTLQSSIDEYLTTVSQKYKPADDRIGEISFQQDALIDSLPAPQLSLESKAIRDPGNGTDIAGAIQLGLATLRKDAMHRILLISDGNATQGDTQAAVSAAAAQHVPIDVMPLHYDIQHEVLMDHFIAPAWKRENEPITIDIILKSTNDVPVTGKLSVTHQGVPMELDPQKPGQTDMPVTLQPGLNPFHIKVPPLGSRGVHQFHANFEPDVVATADGKPPVIDTITSNNSGDAFTFVQGKGQILYVDNTHGPGDILIHALHEEGVEISTENHITPDQFRYSLVQLQNYDAVILANVPYGPDGLSEEQQRNLATYVHDMGGGLVMIGGPETFGAGGWQGRKLEEVLPVNMDIPAQRQIPKGALVLAMDSAEVPDGNTWSEQCAMKAVETLSSQDDIGIITWSWGGNGGNCNWDLPLGPKGDGSKSVAAIKKWGLGDLPSFDQCINTALDGDATSKGLLADDARQKHIIVITDDDPVMPTRATINRCIAAKVTVSTITVYPHQPHNVAPGTRELAKLTGGRSFGPIEDNPAQLPQIFVKEATVVRRSLITEDSKGIPLKRTPSSSDMMKGISDLPPVRGMVLTSRKNNPQIEMPIVAGRNNDPILAHWQTGLGRAAVFTSDASNQWGVWWVGSPDFNKFWAQVVRGVARPPMSSLFDIQTSQSGDKGKIVVEALDKDSGFQNFLNIAGKVAGPDSSKPPVDVRLVPTGPGRYEGTFNTPDPGTYVAAMQYHGPKGEQGMLLGGVAMNDSPEMRDLQSNDSGLADIAARTGGRVLTPFDPASADLFSRLNLPPAVSPLPVWDVLLPILVALILLDVAARRIAWDWIAIRRYAATTAGAIRNFTATRKIETRAGLDALKKVRDDSSSNIKPPMVSAVPLQSAVPPTVTQRPNPQAKFEAKIDTRLPQTDITASVGGATDKPLPAAPQKIEPKGARPENTGITGLLEAKRRAQQKIKEKEQ